MFVKDVMVQNQVGLHARPATFFIQKANEFKSSIWIEKEERRVNAKSLLGILSLGIVGGTQIRITLSLYQSCHMYPHLVVQYPAVQWGLSDRHNCENVSLTGGDPFRRAGSG